ncbi:ATP-dependent DNA helicase [Aphis craccivora]|uniref:ATP-dependent DNA helicase n=1 Tax=Aphis craccivora TaxID=307492 RepID=A0A6G0VZ81_APHCR|nr:ATP-dependent DNA helicase [Aphis craccivora]
MLKFDTAGRSTVDFFANIFQRYENRPLEHADYNFPAMCLLEFAMRFQPHYRKPRGEGNVDQDANDEVPGRQRKTIIKLIDKSEIIARNVTAAVRVPYFVAAN